jgi:hypothetical protein
VSIGRGLRDTIGAIVALLSGTGYFLFAFSSAWSTDDTLVSLSRWAALSVLIIAATMILLTSLLRPTRTWLLPLTFSLVSLIAGIYGLRDPAGPELLWPVVALLTLTVAFAAAYLTRLKLGF